MTLVLVAVQQGMMLEQHAANAWNKVVREISGVKPTISYPAGAFRSEEMVVDMWHNPRKYGATKGTARPRSLGGPGSVHQNGKCVDVWNWDAIPELATVMGRNGFHRTIGNEPWHYEYRPTETAGDTPEPFTEQEEEEMLKPIQIHYRTQTGTIMRALLVPGTDYFVPFSGRTAIANDLARGLDTGNSIEVDSSMYRALMEGRPIGDFQPPA